MKKILLAAASLLVIGAGCLTAPAITPVTTETIPGAGSPAPAPAPDPYGPEAKADLIVVESLAPGDYVASPLTVTGRARGTWYFEASFPVQLLDGNGNVLASGPAQAQGDWMTTEFVPFAITLPAFAAPGTANGTLVLKKDNPSGLPEHEDELRIPVRFNYGIVPPPTE